MIDYFFRWSDVAAAKADALMLAEHLHVDPNNPEVREWAMDHCLPNVKAWRPSQDTVVDGKVVHAYLTGWMAIISLNRQVDILLNAAALAFAMDRDGPPYLIKNNIGAIITDIACEPIFTGSHYPIGGYT